MSAKNFQRLRVEVDPLGTPGTPEELAQLQSSTSRLVDLLNELCVIYPPNVVRACLIGTGSLYLVALDHHLGTSHALTMEGIAGALKHACDRVIDGKASPLEPRDEVKA
jgi:hypothetical protein